MKKLDLILILAFATFICSCEKDLEETISQIYPENTNFSSRTIPLSDLPQIESYIKNLT